MNNLEKAIFRTISYYDIFDYPLTGFEIWKRLYIYRTTLNEVIQALENSLNLKRYLETRDGFYFLKGRKSLIETFKIRRDYSVRKWKKALRATKIIRFIPFVKAVFLCNSVPYLNARKDSDIDLFIIIKDQYIWLARFFITFLLHIFRMRRHGNKISNRICLSFYITDKSLDLRKYYDKDNMYLHYWIQDLRPIFSDGIYRNFLDVNSWIKDYIPNGFEEEIVDDFIIKDSYFSKTLRKFAEGILNNIFGKFLNLVLKKLQLMKMSLNKDSRMDEDNDCVIVNDQMLKFHEAGMEGMNRLLEKMKIL